MCVPSFHSGHLCTVPKEKNFEYAIITAHPKRYPVVGSTTTELVSRRPNESSVSFQPLLTARDVRPSPIHIYSSSLPSPLGSIMYTHSSSPPQSLLTILKLLRGFNNTPTNVGSIPLPKSSVLLFAVLFPPTGPANAGIGGTPLLAPLAV